MIDTGAARKTQTQLDELSRHLAARREAILGEWRAAIRSISITRLVRRQIGQAGGRQMRLD